jgi:hypothetical protein
MLAREPRVIVTVPMRLNFTCASAMPLVRATQQKTAMLAAMPQRRQGYPRDIKSRKEGVIDTA